MKHIELRRRVERLLYHEFKSDDVCRLLLALRDRPFVGSSVREIGHFLAHPGEREIGPITKAAQDFFDVVSFQFLRLRKTLSVDDLPPETIRVLRANFRLISYTELKSEIGLRRRDASRLLEDLITRFVDMPNGNLKLKTNRQQEIDLFNLLTSYIIVQPAFTGDYFFNELYHALPKKGTC